MLSKEEEIILKYLEEKINKEYKRLEDNNKKLLDEGVITKSFDNSKILNYTYEDEYFNWEYNVNIYNKGINSLIEAYNFLLSQNNAVITGFQLLKPKSIEGYYDYIDIYTIGDIDSLYLNNRCKYLYYIATQGRKKDRPKQMRLDFIDYVYKIYPKEMAEVLIKCQ